MSLKAIKEMLVEYRRSVGHCATIGNVEAEIAALEKVATDLTRLHIGDGVYHVRNSDRVLTDTPTGGNTWEHPDVTAWGEAAQLLSTIAKEAE